MSILTANFKHLYQRRGMWFWYLIVLCQTGFILLPFRVEPFSRCLGYLIVSFLMGVIAGGMQKEVLIKPFSFCLPGHRGVFRPFVFRIGMIVNLLMGCLFASYPATASVNFLLAVLVSGLLGMNMYLYGVHIGFADQAKPSGALLFLLLIGVFLKWDIPLQNLMVTMPILVIALSAGVCIWAWRLLGQDFLARKYCGKLTMGMFDNWNVDKVRKFRQAQADRNITKLGIRFFENLQSFFLAKMKRHEFLSRGRYIWGNLYMGFGQFFSLWRGKSGLAILALIAFFLLAFGFMGEEDADGYKGMVNFLFLLPALVATGTDMIPCRSMLLPAGRKDKFFAAVALVVTMTLLIAAFLLAMTGISLCLESVLPEITFEKQTLKYHAMEISRFYTYFIFMPVALSFAVFFTPAAWLKIVFLVIFMQAWILLEFSHILDLTELIDPAGVGCVILLLWVAFLGILHYRCTKRPLVGQKP